jgi:signal transduction histidine kinase
MISILLLEDSDRDADLETRMLRRNGIDANIERVQTRDAFVAALDRPHDLILADYHLPGFDGVEALEIVRASGSDVPFIFVSGSIGEERAVDALQRGATDYVLKDRLTRLPAAVERALTEHRHRKDRLALEKQLDRASRVDSLGRVAATMAHEFNNVLMGVMQVANMLERFYPGDERASRIASHLQDSISRGRTITSQALRFTNPAMPATQVFDMSEWLASHTPELQSLAEPRHLRLSARMQEAVMMVRADPDQLQQALVNLVMNACDAMTAGGDLAIDLVASDDHVLLRVTDTGAGISRETLGKIFEPLFTTKRNGTGLGLAVVHQVVTAVGGRVDVESQPGVGTTFTIALPRLNVSTAV